LRLLIVTATAAEIAPLVATLTSATVGGRLVSFRHRRHDIDVLTTGVGMVATAVWCSRTIALSRYDLALNLGVCGSFRRDLPAGTVVHVARDRIAELGAEEGDSFLAIEEMGLLGADEFPFRGGELVNDAPPPNAALAAAVAVRGITVNTVHGEPRSIARVIERWHPDTESMEGAAFMYACLTAAVPCAQLRAVSNMVERRNRAAWDLRGAIAALCSAGLQVIDDL
jgi:futalosine hydrolase